MLKIYSIFGRNTKPINLNFLRNYASTPKIIKESIRHELQASIDAYKEKILYSSFIESNFVKMGYSRNKQLERILVKRASEAGKTNFQVQPFPVALKYLYDTTDNGKQQNTDEEHEDAGIPDEIKLPFATAEIEMNSTSTTPTNNWMQDYEVYDESEETDEHESIYGTPDLQQPVSRIPCGGCGAYLHCQDPGLPGYLPSQLFKNKSNDILKTVTCQRCHFLKNYNTAINVTVKPEDYVQMLSTIEDKFALAILMVDLLDFPCSIWPGIRQILGNKRPIVVVGNKVDLLPRDQKGYLEHIKTCLGQSILDAGFAEANVKHIALISATTGFGVEELINKLHNVWGAKGDVYLVGCTNVGKSSLFNALLQSDYCKSEASNLIQKATACPWPGTTLRMLKFPILRPSDYRLFLRTKRLTSERAQKAAEANLRKQQSRETRNPKYATLIGHIGRTFDAKEELVNDQFSMSVRASTPLVLALNEKDKLYANSKWCYDTPGVVQPDQILNLLTTEELLLTIPKQTIKPRVVLVKRGMSLFLAGLGRIDYEDGLESIRLIVYASPNLPITICRTSDADDVYEEFLGTELLGVPCVGEERLSMWPKLESSGTIVVTSDVFKAISCCDILLSSAGWIGVNLPENTSATFKVWTPEKRGIFVRKPALLEQGMGLRGPRIRGSLAYREGKAFKVQ